MCIRTLHLGWAQESSATTRAGVGSRKVPDLVGQMAQGTPPRKSLNCFYVWAATQPQHSCKRLHQRQRHRFSMAFLSDPTTSAFEDSSVKRSLPGTSAKAVRGGFARIYISLPERMQDGYNMRACSQDVHTDLIPCCRLHKSQVKSLEKRIQA